MPSNDLSNVSKITTPNTIRIIRILTDEPIDPYRMINIHGISGFLNTVVLTND